jgi:hypothetical protein
VQLFNRPLNCAAHLSWYFLATTTWSRGLCKQVAWRATRAELLLFEEEQAGVSLQELNAVLRREYDTFRQTRIDQAAEAGAGHREGCFRACAIWRYLIIRAITERAATDRGPRGELLHFKLPTHLPKKRHVNDFVTMNADAARELKVFHQGLGGEELPWDAIYSDSQDPASLDALFDRRRRRVRVVPGVKFYTAGGCERSLDLKISRSLSKRARRAIRRARPRFMIVEVELGAHESFTGEVKTNGYVVQASVCRNVPHYLDGKAVPFNKLPGRLRHGRRELLGFDRALQASLLDVNPAPSLDIAQDAFRLAQASSAESAEALRALADVQAMHEQTGLAQDVIAQRQPAQQEQQQQRRATAIQLATAAAARAAHAAFDASRGLIEQREGSVRHAGVADNAAAAFEAGRAQGDMAWVLRQATVACEAAQLATDLAVAARQIDVTYAGDLLAFRARHGENGDEGWGEDGDEQDEDGDEQDEHGDEEQQHGEHGEHGEQEQQEQHPGSNYHYQKHQ